MRRIAWAAVPLALLLVGAWLSSLAEVRPVATARAAVEFPRSFREREYRRMKERRTLVLPAPAPSVAAAGRVEPAAPVRRDPFLAALPAGADDEVVVLEANALRHSRLGEALVRCALARDPRTFEDIRRQTGIDVLKDVDRIAYAGGAVVVSGFFQQLSRDELRKATGAAPERYGEAGTVYEGGRTRPGMAAGTWGDQLLVVADDAAVVRRSLDQLEGRAPPPRDLPDEIAYGEAYGVIPAQALRRILRNDSDLLADRLAAAATRIELHMDAMQDVAAVVRFRGEDEPALSDLARAVGGVLAGARLQAQASGDPLLSDLLDQASVSPGPRGFTVQVALPAELVERWFSDCRP